MKRTSYLFVMILLLILPLITPPPRGYAAGGPENTNTFAAQEAGQQYSSGKYGFNLWYPSDWAAETTLDNENDFSPEIVIDQRVAFRPTEEPKITVDVWHNDSGKSLWEWFELYHKPLLQTESLTPSQPNARIAGEEAVFSVEFYDEKRAATFSLLLARQEYIYRLEYYALDGGQAIEVYRKILLSFQFDDQGDNASDELPEFPVLAPQPLSAQSDSCCGVSHPGNPYPCSGGNCTWWAYHKRPDTGGKSGSYWGNAANWDDRAIQEGFTIKSTPTVGAIAVSNYNYYGHVAYVKSYNSSIVTVSEMNYFPDRQACSSSRYRTSKTYRLGGFFTRYIYPKDTTPNPSNVVVETPTLSPAYDTMCNSHWYRFTNNRRQAAYLTRNATNAGQSSNSGIWRFTPSKTGLYKIEAYIPDHGNIAWSCPSQTVGWDTEKAQYTIQQGSYKTTVTGNQKPLRNEWLDLKTYSFVAGTEVRVTLSDVTGESFLSHHVSFSAMRFRYVGETPPPPPPPVVQTCLKGKITDENGAALSGVTLDLIKLNTQQKITTQTDSNGNYSFTNLAPGKYSLIATHLGYSPDVAWVINLGQSCSRFNFRLKKLPDSNYAETYAPIIKQFTFTASGHPDSYKADYITAFNYDGNWQGTDNWNNLYQGPSDLRGYVYWKAEQSNNHQYLLYYLYHPQDWGGNYPIINSGECLKENAEGPSDNKNKACHENDLEGIAISVNKQTNIVDGIAAVFHFPILMKSCKPNIMPPARVSIYSEPKSHALHCNPSDNEIKTLNDAIYYIYTGNPPEPPTRASQTANYGLLNVDQALKSPGIASGIAFTSDSNKFRGNDYQDNAASTPWNNEIGPALSRKLKSMGLSSLSSSSYVGDLFTDPARVFAALFPEDNHISSYVSNNNLEAIIDYSPDEGSWAIAPLGDATLYLPPEALSNTATVTMTYGVPADLSIDAMSGNTPLSLVSRPFSLQVRQNDGSTPENFNTPVDIQILFSTEGVEDVDPSTLQMMHWQNGVWQPLSFEIDASDPANLSLYAAIDSPGTFGLFGVVVEPAANINTNIYLPIVTKDN